MTFFLNWSIQKKLAALVTLAASAALVFACATFVLYELGTFRGDAINQARAAAQIVAGTSTAALAFADSKGAAENLNALRGENHIVEAGLYRADGTMLAGFDRDHERARLPARPAADGIRFSGADLVIFQPVMLDNLRVGTLYIRRDLSDVTGKIRQYIGITLLVLIVSCMVALAISGLLQRVISKPILQLAETASRVSRESNYSVRAVAVARDEIGTLVDRFNEMLGQIQLRDEALRAARDELEDRVQQRTQQLQLEIAERKLMETDLVAAKDAAIASNRAKSLFLANMSHELRTPLNAIIGYSELLEEDALALGNQETIPDLRRINGAGKHLLGLISDVLDLSKIEAGHMEVQMQPCDIGSLVDDAAGTAQLLVRKNGNQFIVNCQERATTIETDPLKFKQSLLNLLSNAGKFTENGTIRLDVERNRDSDGEWLDWSVSDTGIGISPSQLDKLFKSFSQVDDSHTRRHGGTGLGLAISKKLCELMGGTILVDSEPGKGSRFTMRLPAPPSRSNAEVAV